MSHLHASALASNLGHATDDHFLEATARRRAGARMGWYVHAMVYLAVNAVLMLIAIAREALARHEVEIEVITRRTDFRRNIRRCESWKAIGHGQQPDGHH